MDADQFYAWLSRIEASVGCRRPFLIMPSTQELPAAGVYFFFDPNERRQGVASGPRVVRVGTHSVSLGSKTSVRDRLRQHWGTEKGGGHSGGSQFRYLVGAGITGSYEWLKESSREPGTIDQIEKQISEYIRAMSLLVVPVSGDANKENLRAILERNSIGILSNINRTVPDVPSCEWLGKKCPKDKIGKSGLWNINFVTRQVESNFSIIAEAIAQSLCDTRRLYR